MKVEIKRTNLPFLYKYYKNNMYITNNNTLIKNCFESENAPSFISLRIEYMNNLEYLKGITKPINIICDNNITYGYEMPFLQKYKTIYESIHENNKISLKDKKEMLIKLNNNLKNINKYYIIGDIHLSNIMLNSKDGNIYIIDWENGTPVDKGYNIYALFSFNELTPLQNDAFKMFICSISYIYSINFVDLLSGKTFNSVLYMLKELKLSHIINTYLNDLEYEVNSNSKRVVYFEDYIKNIRESSFIRKRTLISRYNDMIKTKIYY